METPATSVEALLKLAALLPQGWEWNAVRGQRIKVHNGSPGAALVVSVEDSVYRVEIEPGQPTLGLAPTGEPENAVDALERVFAVALLVAASGFETPDDAA